MKIPQITRFVSFLFALSLLASCSAGDGDNLAPSSTEETGRVSLLITDAPSVDFDQINLTLESISFIPDDNDDSLDTEGETAKEIIVFDESRVINLLALQNFSDLLATTMLPVGSYSKIRLHVSQVKLVNLNPDGSIDESNSYIAKLPANGKIDLNPQGSFDVTGGGHLMIELDVDAEKSIHIVETGKGYNFRPVIFVNILGEDELKLVILDGKVLERTETGFQLCKVDAVAVDDHCLAVLMSANTVTQDDLIVVVEAATVENNDIVTVLGKAGAKNVDALHVVIAAADKEVQNLGLFTGVATSGVDIDNNFGMKTDDDNPLVLPETSLTVTIAEGARLFDKYGTVLADDKISNGVDVDVFGLAIPDLSTVSKVKAAFVIVNDDFEVGKYTGVISAVNKVDDEITVIIVDGAFVDGAFSGDACVDIGDAVLLLLESAGADGSSEEITIDQLLTGMSVDVYGDYENGEACSISADVVLVTDNP